MNVNNYEQLQRKSFKHRYRISVANFQVLGRSRNYRIFNLRTVVYPLKYLSQYNSLPFLTHAVYTAV